MNIGQQVTLNLKMDALPINRAAHGQSHLHGGLSGFSSKVETRDEAIELQQVGPSLYNV